MHKADAEDFGLVDDLTQRQFQQSRVDEAADVQILGNIICRVRQIDALSEPNSKLGIR
jgi:hypothetical protein